ncbi:MULTISPECIES: GNAT family N-acetyltransferase [unclassified Solwaraspora]|uniref:GNAT family N-acetyltransferase n=1 Tax=unclassified Solwaraspora TaxID=2627926 RepID=UPI00248C32E5|nr:MULTISPECIES: GNAT family N-acetyltransferase [unclassified Solwaraspora]WBB95871.1 GNAT family N-acetyltransferase [Solwaraspora sp. WMMA2059]WBC20225.1 GNAT family N-acetyltransferase [Solwaraspora sp. WMMA2080]WJK32191.1 GNAT family N-acetyltransferase [Solwaraspora sp. WMMA2065]
MTSPDGVRPPARHDHLTFCWESIGVSPSRTSSDHDGPRPADAPALVREATLADVDQLTEVHTLARTAYYTAAGGLDPADPSLSSPAAYAERRTAWANAVTSPELFTVAAVLDSRVVGCAAMGPAFAGHVDPGRVGQLYQIHVLPDCWGRGIGGLLHDAFVAYLERTGRTGGLLEAWERNGRAQRFYAARGWQADGHSRPGPGDTRYIYLQLGRAAVPCPA